MFVYSISHSGALISTRKLISPNKYQPHWYALMRWQNEWAVLPCLHFSVNSFSKKYSNLIFLITGGDLVRVSSVWLICPAERSERNLPDAVGHVGERHRRANHQVRKEIRKEGISWTCVVLTGNSTCNWRSKSPILFIHSCIIYFLVFAI